MKRSRATVAAIAVIVTLLLVMYTYIPGGDIIRPLHIEDLRKGYQSKHTAPLQYIRNVNRTSDVHIVEDQSMPLDLSRSNGPQPQELSKNSPVTFTEMSADTSGVFSSFNSREIKLCQEYNTSTSTCSSIQKKEPVIPKTVYPLQLVSGAPGSGNDWTVWLGAVHGYHQTQEHLLAQCEAYHRDPTKWLRITDSPGRYYTHCPYVKTHEPWLLSVNHSKSYVLQVDRAAILLRHPFDSALSEFKRQSIGPLPKGEDRINVRGGVKSRTNGISVDLFLTENLTTIPYSNWSRYYPRYIKSWLSHAKFWLQTYSRSLHVIIYKDFVNDLSHQLSDMLNFFGYRIDGDNIHRHCCILDHPINEKIIRQTSAIDSYKEMLLEKDPVLKKLCEDAVSQVQGILDIQWPGLYQIHRG